MCFKYSLDNEPKIESSIETMKPEGTLNKAVQKSQVIEEEKKIIYFVHDTLQTKEKFNSLQNNVLLKLKRLAEKVSVTLIYSDLHSEDLAKFKRETVNEEVALELKSLSQFEQNLLLCLVDQFEVLRSFHHPEVSKEVKAEYSWITKNFPEYIKLLKTLQSPPLNQNANEENISIDPATNISFSDDFTFCTEHTPVSVVPSSQTLALSKAIEIFRSKAALFQNMYLNNDDLIESFLSLFFVQYTVKLSLNNSSLLQLISEICNYAPFEMRIIDFCIFFLYTPEYFDIQSDARKFPYTKLLNSDVPQQSTNVYQVTALNILDFLRYYLQTREYILYQPRLYLEQFGLKSIQDLKSKTQFLKSTSGMVSVADLAIGLFQVKEIASNTKLMEEWENLIKTVFHSSKKFEVISSEEIDEKMDKMKVISPRTCRYVIDFDKLQIVLMNIPDIVIKNIKLIIKVFETKVDTLSNIVEETNLVLKPKLRDRKDEIESIEIKKLLSNVSDLVALGRVLGAVSSTMSTWFINRSKQSGQGDASNAEENDKIYEKIFQSFDERVISQKHIEDFIINLFELASYIANTQASIQKPQVKSLTFQIVKICLHYYGLISIREAYHKTVNMARVSEDALLSLSKIISTDSIDDQNNFPELLDSFSTLRTSREFDFGILFSSMAKNYQEHVSKLACEVNDSKVIIKEMYIICSKLPWALDFAVKRKALA